jgi:hypothetical protein
MIYKKNKNNENAEVETSRQFSRRQFIETVSTGASVLALGPLGLKSGILAQDPSDPISLLPKIPYPKSEVIKGIRWLNDPIGINPKWVGDTWSSTWAKDGNIYTVADDTCGNLPWEKAARNLAIDLVEGNPPNHKIIRINSMDQWGVAGDNGWWKGAGLASIDSILYLGIYSQSRPRPGNATKISFSAFYSSIMKSEDNGKTWEPRPNDGPALFPLFPGREFPTPYFVQYGQDYADAVDHFVYIVSNDGGWNNWNKMKLARVPREKMPKLDLADWEFFVKCNHKGMPEWSNNVMEAGSIFEHKGYTSMTGIQYVPFLKRYIMGQWAYIGVKGTFDRTELCPEKYPWGDNPAHHVDDATMLCLYESLNPWGPWSWFHIQEKWGPSYYTPGFPSKWFENGGRKMWIVEGGNYRTPPGYEFLVQQMEIMV